MEKKKWWRNLAVIRRIILIAVNIVAPFIMFFAGLLAGGYKLYLWVIFGEILFIGLSLTVYYLSIIAHSVSQMAKISKEEE
ncbi:MAG: hypothetical protein HFE41_02950 [Clostridia bacterium]|jgi:hypothetical protein|nr:hypothetical protein [Clostridia bacterium]